MKVGTKSVLFGAHCFLIHPIIVAIAWIKLYGFPWDPRIWVAFFVHDLGYWGKPNMDGPEGESHVELGAKASGELKEYMELAKSRNMTSGDSKYDTSKLSVQTPKQWHQSIKQYCRDWVRAHKDGQDDTWTKANKNFQ